MVDMDAPRQLRNRSRLADEVQAQLREEIYRGQLAPGAVLNQEKLAEHLQVSRTPLREALRVLESEGILSLRRGNRVEVVSLDDRTLLDACLTRQVIDGFAARLAAEREGAGAEADLKVLLAKQRDALEPFDSTAFQDADAGMHERVILAGENKFLVAMIPLVRMTVQVFIPRRAWGSVRARDVLDEHTRIIEAVIAEDADAAEFHARAHAGSVVRMLQDEISANPTGD